MSESKQSTIISSLPVLLGRIRAQRPLVHHITNMVVMNDTANITLGIGASPVMAHALEEVEEMVRLAGALVLNIGTLTPEQIVAMRPRWGRWWEWLRRPGELTPFRWRKIAR